MKKITDKERMDFLQKQKFTRWVGYNKPNGYVVWPVFSGADFRSEVDKAILASGQKAGNEKASR